MNHQLNGKAKSHEVHYDDATPKAGPAIFVKRLKGQEAVTVAVLGDHVHGVWTHWGKGKSEPHFRDPDHCPGCQARRPKRWKGYLHVFDYQANREIFLELTPHSANTLTYQLGRKDMMRGERIRVERSKGDNGRLTIAVLGAEKKIEALPAEKDPRPTILKLWGIDQDDPEGWLEEREEGEGEERFRL